MRLLSAAADAERQANWNKTMDRPEDEIEPLLERIRAKALPDLAEAGAVSLLNLIPFAGGAVASVVGQFASQRRFERICDVLASLHSNLEEAQADPERHLSKDQIVELVHETLQSAVTTSDERKLTALKQALAQAFLSDEPFDRKQLFLKVLRESTSLELVVLPLLYAVRDPYVVGHRPPGDKTAEDQPLQVGPADGFVHLAPGFWHAIGNRENPGGQTLLQYLAQEADLDAGVLEGILRLLDAKGLANASPNLQRSDWKIVEWLPMPGKHLVGLTTASIVQKVRADIRPSPLEATRTAFGRAFLKFWRSESTVKSGT